MQRRKLKTVALVTLPVLAGLLSFSVLVIAANPRSTGKQNADPNIEEMRAGKNFIATTVYSAEEDQQILKLFEGLRVSDVADGMDKVGLTNVGLMSPEIHAAWKDTTHFAHRFVGIAVTVRYVPTNKPPAPPMETAAFDKWVGQWYSKLSTEPFVPLIRRGTALVFDDAPESDVGSIGSNNIMGWKSRGCVGVVTDATARDTDEIATEKMPLYFRQPGRGIRPGRNEIESVNRPIVCGSVLVKPGDVIVADGDGVIVVPRAVAKEVADTDEIVILELKGGIHVIELPADAKHITLPAVLFKGTLETVGDFCRITGERGKDNQAFLIHINSFLSSLMEIYCNLISR